MSITLGDEHHTGGIAGTAAPRRQPSAVEGGHDRIATLVAAIDDVGYGVIPNFVGDADLERMRRFVAKAIADANGGYAGFIGPNSMAGSGLDELARSPSFRSLMEQIYRLGTGRPPPRQELYQTLRCLTGRSAGQHSYLFHYDSYVVTLLIPIEIPTVGRTGDLLMLPNTRRIRSAYLFNAMDKVVLDNPVTQAVLKGLTTRNILRPTRIRMVPGNAYVFWGYRSIHTNEPCDMGNIRATALFHFANPHAPSAPA